MKPEMNPLFVSEERLAQHFCTLEAIINRVASTEVTARVVADWGVTPLSVGLVGKGCEIVSRKRGSDAYVAPLLCCGQGIWAWLGFYQEWASEPKSRRGRRYSYRSTGLTIHFGFRNLRHKPQIFCAEWAGWAKWNGQSYNPQAGNAGHPHWQFDGVGSLKQDDSEQRARTYLDVLSGEAKAAEPQTFSPQGIKAPEINEIVGSKDFSRLHFASVAAWWKKVPEDMHAHFPSSESDVEAWVKKTIEYTVEELDRLH